MLCRAAPHFTDPPPYCDERNPLPDDQKIVEFFYNLGIHVSPTISYSESSLVIIQTPQTHPEKFWKRAPCLFAHVIKWYHYLWYDRSSEEPVKLRSFQHYNLLRINVYHWNLLFPGNMFSNSKMDSAPPTRQPSPAPPPFPAPPVSYLFRDIYSSVKLFMMPFILDSCVCILEKKCVITTYLTLWPDTDGKLSGYYGRVFLPKTMSLNVIPVYPSWSGDAGVL